MDCQPGRGSESAPTRPAPRHLSLLLPDRGWMCGLSLLAPSIQLIHLQPFRVTRSWRRKDTLNHRLSRATPEVRVEVQVVEEGLSFSF